MDGKTDIHLNKSIYTEKDFNLELRDVYVNENKCLIQIIQLSYNKSYFYNLFYNRVRNLMTSSNPEKKQNPIVTGSTYDFMIYERLQTLHESLKQTLHKRITVWY